MVGWPLTRDDVCCQRVWQVSLRERVLGHVRGCCDCRSSNKWLSRVYCVNSQDNVPGYAELRWRKREVEIGSVL
jgi:hypothetical protein